MLSVPWCLSVLVAKQMPLRLKDTKTSIRLVFKTQGIYNATNHHYRMGHSRKTLMLCEIIIDQGNGIPKPFLVASTNNPVRKVIMFHLALKPVKKELPLMGILP